MSVVEVVERDTKVKEYVVVRRKLWAHAMTVRIILNALYPTALFRHVFEQIISCDLDLFLSQSIFVSSFMSVNLVAPSAYPRCLLRSTV